eukprot:364642-Chlamydomonas_euryale.AAC.5
MGCRSRGRGNRATMQTVGGARKRWTQRPSLTSLFASTPIRSNASKNAPNSVCTRHLSRLTARWHIARR